MKVITEHIVGREPEFVLVQPTDRHEEQTIPEELEGIGTERSYALVLVHLDNWALDLMPWADRMISRSDEAGKRAGQTLQFILDEVLPKYPNQKKIIGGYSLAGLFALWASMQTDTFTAVAAASPSLWMAEWIPYAESHKVLAKDVYLSLGDREEVSKNKAIARVGDCVRQQHELLLEQLGAEHTTLVMEEGNHFADNAGRLARAFKWTMERYGR